MDTSSMELKFIAAAQGHRKRSFSMCHGVLAAVTHSWQVSGVEVNEWRS